MTKLINKAIYLNYLACPKNAWLMLHRPDMEEFTFSETAQNLVRESHRIKNLACKLFPGGKLFVGNDITRDSVDAWIRDESVFFRATFSSGFFRVRTEILECRYEAGLRGARSWHLYEIKGSSSQVGQAGLVEESFVKQAGSPATESSGTGSPATCKASDVLESLSFQAVVLQEQGIELSSVSLVMINKNYILDDQIELEKLFCREDVTQQVKNIEHATREHMLRAKIDLLHDSEDQLSCFCIYKGRNSHCPTFAYSHPYVPKDAIYTIASISKDTLQSLVESGIFAIKNIPEISDEVPLVMSAHQRRQIAAHKQNVPYIDHEAIQKQLATLRYPLYFLDYETSSRTVPVFSGGWPYQTIPFQFSLHSVESPGSTPRHHEYLHELASDPSISIIKKLQEYIGAVGTIIVWCKHGEQGVHDGLAQRHPEYKDFLHDINSRIYDLWGVFCKQLYIHPGFEGKTSLKKVLPVLRPDLSYKELAIQDGMGAMHAWLAMIDGNLLAEEKFRVASELRNYCYLDTYAMYAIWDHLRSM